jgi:hypothetical protein
VWFPVLLFLAAGVVMGYAFYKAAEEGHCYRYLNGKITCSTHELRLTPGMSPYEIPKPVHSWRDLVWWTDDDDARSRSAAAR